MAWQNINIVTSVNIASAGAGVLTCFPAANCSELVVYNTSDANVLYVTTSLNATLSGKIPVLPNSSTVVQGITNSNQVSAIPVGTTDIYAVARYYSAASQPW